MGLRIIQRVREEYGGDADAHIAEEMNPFTNPSKPKQVLQADTGMDSTSIRDLFSHVDDTEDVGGGFLVDDDGSGGGGGFLPEGHDEVKVPHGVGELTIEDERGPANSDPPNVSLPLTSDLANCGPSDTDGSEGASTEAGPEDKITIPKKTSENRKKAATNSSGRKGRISTNLPQKRAAPQRKAARKSETALKSHFFQNESDEDDNGNRESSESEEVVKKPAKRKRNKHPP